MVDFLKRLFEKPDTAAESPQDRDHSLRLATAALFFEIVRADGEVKDEERRTMQAAIRSAFDIAPNEIDALVTAAEERSRSAASLYELTHLVDTSLDATEKKRIVELLWLLAFADARKDPLEEHLVRKVAGLLHVPHPDFIDAKIRARRSLG